MINSDLLSINNVADKLQLSVHQLRRWELMFGLEIKRGRGQQRQYRPEDLSVLERIKELVEQGWPTSQIRPQLEAEGLLTPKLIGMPTNPGNPEVLQESIIGLRSFVDWKFKGSFWLSGGYELNYRTAISGIDQLKDLHAWQQSGLLGLTKKFDIKLKFFKHTKLQLLWDFLSYRQLPRTQPILFRVGYGIQ